MAVLHAGTLLWHVTVLYAGTLLWYVAVLRADTLLWHVALSTKCQTKGSSTRHPAMASLGNCSPGCEATCRIAASRPLSVDTSLHFIPPPLVSLREALLAPRCSCSMSTIARTTCCQVLVWLCMQMTLPSITASQHVHLTPQVCCKLLLMPWPGGEELGRSLLSQRSHR